MDQKPYPIKFSVVIPTYNEMHRLPATLHEITPFLQKNFRDYEIVIVDDASSDGTSDYVKGLKDAHIRVYDQPGRIGKGAAVRVGCLGARGDYILYMDADHATPIDEVSHFMPIALKHPNAVIMGARTYQDDESRWRRILGLLAQLATHLILFKKAVIDSQCGFKLFPKDVAARLFSKSRTKGGMMDAEIIYLMHKYNISTYFEAVHWKNKAGSRINILGCLVRDPIELCRIRLRDAVGVYGS